TGINAWSNSTIDGFNSSVLQPTVISRKDSIKRYFNIFRILEFVLSYYRTYLYSQKSAFFTLLRMISINIQVDFYQ
ncbi:MAG: hypothetical protein ACI81W_004138, partial [Saprospiraceae bacterium]